MSTWPSFLLRFGVLLVVIPDALGQPPLCDGSVSDSTAIKHVRVADDHLVVEIRWSARTAPESQVTIQTLNRHGELVASTTVEPKAGAFESYPVSEEGDLFREHGYWLTTRLIDDAGEQVASEVPAVITLCPPDAGCTYSVLDGVSSDTLTMGDELFDLMDELESTGSQDLLQDALHARPDLEHEISWVAAQLDFLLPAKDPASCACLWNAVVRQRPASHSHAQSGPSSVIQSDPDWETLTREGPGGNLYVAGQILGGTSQVLTAKGHARARLHLRCRQAVTHAADFWAATTAEVPTFRPCTSTCADTTIDVTAEALTQAAGNGWASAQHGARGAAYASTSFFLGAATAPTLTSLAAIDADRPPGNSDLATLGDFPTVASGDWLITGGDASVSFESEGEIALCLESHGAATDCLGSYTRASADPAPWAFGCAAVAVKAALTGYASCAVEPQRKVRLQQMGITHTQNGLLIVPWNP